jgi:hypothetical protein
MNKIIFTAMSKKNFFQKWRVVKFVLEQGSVPLNPFMLYDYFLVDSVDHDLVRDANHKIIERCDEVWVFGEIADGVEREVEIAKRLNKPTKYFDISKLPEKIKEISEKEIVFEGD